MLIRTGLAAILATLIAAPCTGQTLDQTLSLALERSPALAAAQARVDAASAAVAQARAERNPSASIQGQVGFGHIDPQGFFGLPADNVTPRVAQIGADWPLFAGGRISAAMGQARTGHDLAELGAKSARLDVRLRVIQAYVQALTAQQRVASLSDTERTLTEALRSARLLFKSGAGTSTDVAQAQARLAEAQAGLAGAKGALAASLAQLEQLAGQPITLDQNLPAAPDVPATSDAAVAAALADNPRLAAARKSADLAAIGVRAARAEAMPTLGAYAEASSIRDQFFPGYKADSASVGLRAKWSFFSGGRVGAKVDKAAAEARAASADADAAEQAVTVQAVQAFAMVEAARASLLANEQRAQAAQEALRSARLEVQTGAKPQLALLDATREASAAETARIEAAGDLLTKVHMLRSLVGYED